MVQVSGMGAPPRGEGGIPCPALPFGEGGVPRLSEKGGFPAPPRPARKNDQSRGEVAGQNKGHILKCFQKRKVMMEQYCNTE